MAFAPLEFAPTPNVGPSMGNAIQNANQLLALQQAQQQVKSQNALRGILSQPGAIGADGVPTPETFQKVTGADPEAAMRLQQNALAMMEHRSNLQSSRIKRQQELSDLAEPLRIESYDVYQGTPGDPAAKNAAAQRVYSARVEEWKNGGGLSKEEAAQIPGNFDVNRVLANSPTLQARLASERKQALADTKEADANKRDDARQAEAKRYHDLLAARENPAAQNQANINAIADDQIHKAEAARGGPLSDAEKAQIRLTAGDTAAAAKNAAKNAPVVLSDDDRKSLAAQAATGQQLNQIVPGYRQDATALRQQVRSDAIKKIMADTGMSAEDAGTELANRTIEYQSGKKSSGQLTTMLGATKQAVGQLDFNIDQVKQDMAKLPSTDLSPILNAMVRGEEKWTGDPAYSALFYHMHATAVESARILSGGQASTAQLHQGAMEEAQKWAGVNMTPASFEAVAKAMKDEGQYRVKTYEDAIKGQRLGGPGAATPAATTEKTAPDKPAAATGGAAHPDVPSPLSGKSDLQWNANMKMWRDGSGAIFNADGTPAQPKAAATPAAAPPEQAAAQPAQPAAAAPPQLPAGVPQGSAYSPSRKMWRDPSGKIYDASGKQVGA